MRLFRVLLFSGLLLPVSSPASLMWEIQRVSQTATAGDKEAVALFPFKNTGTTTVTIRGIETSCECTVAELAKRTYAPGEAGTIRAVFTLGERMGRQERLITVAMDDPYAPIASLTMQIEIPERLSYSAHLVRWMVGGEREEQTVEVEALGDNRIAAIEVKTIQPALAAVRVQTLEGGRQYRLFIQPDRVDKATTIAIAFTARFADGTERAFLIYALVR